jgi:hypothetical protein
LCDAEIITPRSARSERVSIATAGVGIGPSRKTSMTDRGEAGHQRVLDHVARKPGILADHHTMAMIAAAEERAGRLATRSARSGVITPLAIVRGFHRCRNICVSFERPDPVEHEPAKAGSRSRSLAPAVQCLTKTARHITAKMAYTNR